MLSLLSIVILTSSSFGFLDFLGEQSKKAVEVAGFVDAASELVTEISPNEDIDQGAKDIRERAEKLRASASEIRGLSRSTKSLLAGPDWTSKRLETNIRNTTSYVRKLNRVVSRAAILGTDGAIALNTLETNLALNEMQKNQQAMILQLASLELRSLEKEQEEAQSWEQFIKKQRSLRQNKDVTFGKPR